MFIYSVGMFLFVILVLVTESRGAFRYKGSWFIVSVLTLVYPLTLFWAFFIYQPKDED